MADETRLQILERLALDDAVRAQALIDQLEVSQPTVSRHLKFLKNGQWISEQRSGTDASKLYRFNRDRVGSFAYTLEALLSAENARVILQDMRANVPDLLRPFLNSEGHIVSWPTKRKPQHAVLTYLSEKIQPDHEYTESELTQLLGRWLVHVDAVHLRRELIDFNYLVRTKNGSRYWLNLDRE